MISNIIIGEKWQSNQWMDCYESMANDVKWIKASEIDDYNFCPADDQKLIKLKKSSYV